MQLTVALVECSVVLQINSVSIKELTRPRYDLPTYDYLNCSLLRLFECNFSTRWYTGLLLSNFIFLKFEFDETWKSKL